MDTNTKGRIYRGRKAKEGRAALHCFPLASTLARIDELKELLMLPGRADVLDLVFSDQHSLEDLVGQKDKDG